MVEFLRITVYILFFLWCILYFFLPLRGSIFLPKPSERDDRLSFLPRKLASRSVNGYS